MNKKIGFIVTAGHLDIEWYQPMRSFRFWTAEIMEDLKRISAERQNFKSYYLDGQVFPLEEHLRGCPEDAPALRRLVQSGMLAIGPFYTQFDEWLPSAEAMIRNCMYGIRKGSLYGKVVMAGYLPDNFGHPPQLPQILRGFGIDSLIFMRGMPELTGDHPDEFIYRGMDGSEVFASHLRESYGGAFELRANSIEPIQPREVPYYSGYLSYEWHRELAEHANPNDVAASLIHNFHRIEERYPSGVVPMISGYDHLPPQHNIGECVRIANEMQNEIEFVMGNPEEYVKEARSRMQDPTVYGMELIGSKYHYLLFGTLSTRSYLKRQHFAAETLMEKYAEPLTAVASRYGFETNRVLIDEAWSDLMINSAHDSIHGSSVDEVHIEMEARYAAVRQVAAGLIHAALKHIARQLKPRHFGAGKAVIVYSPSGSGHPQPCECWLTAGDGPVAVTNAAGKLLPSQALEREPVSFNAAGLPDNERFPLPPFRKVLFMDMFRQSEIRNYVCEPIGEAMPGAMDAGDHYLENEYLRVEIREAVIDILDKRSGYRFQGLNLLEEEADAGDAWDYSPPWENEEPIRSNAFAFSSKLVEHGAVRAAIEVNGTMRIPDHLEAGLRSEQKTDMDIVFRIELYTAIPRVDVAITIDNTARDHRIRLCVPTGLRCGAIRSQGHLAILERPVARPNEIESWAQKPTRLLPFREWLSADDGTQGLAVAVKGLYDYEAAINPDDGATAVFLTLIRGIGMMSKINMVRRAREASWAHTTPGAQCLGRQTAELSYIPYQAVMEDKAPFLATAQCFLAPPVTHCVRSSALGAGSLDRIETLVHWEEPNICLSAFILSADTSGCIVRAYENQGKHTAAQIRINRFSKAYLADMNEKIQEELRLENGMAEVVFYPYQCVTILLM